MMINGGGGGGSGSDEDDVMTTMTATTNGSGGLWDGGGEGRPTMNVTNIAELQFSISSRRIPIASLICSCLYHLPTDAARGITSFRKKSIYWHYLCLAFAYKMFRVKQKICSFNHQYILSVQLNTLLKILIFQAGITKKGDRRS